MNIGSLESKTVLVTGGAGFIGANFLNLYVPRFPNTRFVNLDKLTYAGNLGSLRPIENQNNYSFEKADIADSSAVEAIFEKYRPDVVFHFAAESHVDRSIVSPRDFVETNVVGTFNLLEASRKLWTNFAEKLFHHVSTDEVFGSLGENGFFVETTSYDPSSPYSASKAGSDHLVRAYNRTFGLPVTVTNCSNNYGPYQFPEKLIPVMVLNAFEGKSLPVYGNGKNVRDWLFVTDHCEAIWKVANEGRIGDTYNVGGSSERSNLEVVFAICDRIGKVTGRGPDGVRSQISYVTDRPGHDFRYAIDASKLKSELGWTPRESFETGMDKTIDWYLENTAWIESVKSGEYRAWMQSNYATR